jgi:hypothetical protein
VDFETGNWHSHRNVIVKRKIDPVGSVAEPELEPVEQQLFAGANVF